MTETRQKIDMVLATNNFGKVELELIRLFGELVNEIEAEKKEAEKERDLAREMIIELLKKDSNEAGKNISDDNTNALKSVSEKSKEENIEEEYSIDPETREALTMKAQIFERFADTRYLSKMTIMEIYQAKNDKKAQEKFNWFLYKCNTEKYRKAAQLVKAYFEGNSKTA